eukprot:TRINITY_DN7916_c0_g1_i2.p1 TRINITY_DN7916_c0_g1~~TRINITY_DN7916_c0_g1_i2.p1  ORF type:complete len:131 (-),score=21.97 TRINITY_DN7916_c0_g1_i2:86-478(-)
MKKKSIENTQARKVRRKSLGILKALRKPNDKGLPDERPLPPSRKQILFKEDILDIQTKLTTTAQQSGSDVKADKKEPLENDDVTFESIDNANRTKKCETKAVFDHPTITQVAQGKKLSLNSQRKKNIESP